MQLNQRHQAYSPKTTSSMQHKNHPQQQKKIFKYTNFELVDLRNNLMGPENAHSDQKTPILFSIGQYAL